MQDRKLLHIRITAHRLNTSKKWGFSVRSPPLVHHQVVPIFSRDCLSTPCAYKHASVDTEIPLTFSHFTAVI